MGGDGSDVGGCPTTATDNERICTKEKPVVGVNEVGHGLLQRSKSTQLCNGRMLLRCTVQLRLLREYALVLLVKRGKHGDAPGIWHTKHR